VTVVAADTKIGAPNRPEHQPTTHMSRSADELLYDSEAALRLVDTALHELNGATAEPDPGAPGSTPETEEHPAGEPNEIQHLLS